MPVTPARTALGTARAIWRETSYPQGSGRRLRRRHRGVVSAVGGRLAMSLLASLNPEDAGVRSDDDFVIGQVTFGGTAQLTAATVQLTLVGAALYLLLRPFLVGTGAVRVVTSAIGFGVTFAAVIIHPDGVDFTRLEPLWLGIALFVAVRSSWSPSSPRSPSTGCATRRGS